MTITNTSCRSSRAWPLFPYCQDVDVVFQKSVHGGINPPLNYTVAHPVQLRPCLIGVQGITILYPWRYGKSSVILAPPFGLCPERSSARCAWVKGPPSRAGVTTVVVSMCEMTCRAHGQAREPLRAGVNIGYYVP